MNIRLLGAHNCEARDSRLISLLIDDALAIDAGGLTSGLTFQAQRELRAILLTHQHYDHIRDIPMIAMSLFLQGGSIDIYSTKTVYDALATYLFDGKLYPNFLERPQGNPVIRFRAIEPYQITLIEGYGILAIPVNHSALAVGYQVTSPDGKALFYTGDTGPGLAGCWEHILPRLLITEVTMPDRYEESAKESGHLTPGLLKQELNIFRELKGYLPPVVVVHLNPLLEKEIEGELTAVAQTLGASIKVGYEGMQLYL